MGEQFNGRYNIPQNKTARRCTLWPTVPFSFRHCSSSLSWLLREWSQICSVCSNRSRNSQNKQRRSIRFLLVRRVAMEMFYLLFVAVSLTFLGQGESFFFQAVTRSALMWVRPHVELTDHRRATLTEPQPDTGIHLKFQDRFRLVSGKQLHKLKIKQLFSMPHWVTPVFS